MTCGICVAQSYYVSSSGDDTNNGLSENAPLKSLSIALNKAQKSAIKKIVVTGVLSDRSENVELSSAFKSRFGSVFGFLDYSQGKNTSEILITGKPEATGGERAALSGAGSKAGVIYCHNVKIRFEHIEISGGETPGNGLGILIQDGSTVTLGVGSVIRANSACGILLETGGTCILEGGEIKEHPLTGIGVAGTFIMRGGSIRDNRSPGNGGGVMVFTGGTFTMTGGSITGNFAIMGGGVCVDEGGSFDIRDGSITNNSAEKAGGGVLVYNGGRFDLLGGSVTGNRANQGNDPNVARDRGSPGR
jgi:hypothetical protein